MRQYIEKEKKYAVFKNVRFDKWEPVRKNLVLALLLATLFIIIEIAMSDIDMGMVKKSIEKKNIYKLWMTWKSL